VLSEDHRRWTPPLPLALATPRHTPRRASSHLMIHFDNDNDFIGMAANRLD